MPHRASNVSPPQVPHLSVVAVSRNDDHGSDMLGRMQHFVNGFIAQCCKHRLDAELILVEWNPPADRPPLEDALEWPDDFGPATVRIVTVPPEVHARFPHADALPLFQMIGKNVGIRRARGRYVLATNIDILLDDAIVIYLRDQLIPGTMLRIDRYDVPSDLVKGVSFDQVLAECRNRFFQVSTRFGILDVKRRRFVGMGDGFHARLLALYKEIHVFGFADPVCRAIKQPFQYLFEVATAFGRLFVDGPVAWRVVLKRGAKTFLGAIHLSFWTMLNIPAFLRGNVPKLWPLKTMPSRGYWYVRQTIRRIKAPIAPLMPRFLREAFRALRWLLRKVLAIPRRSLRWLLRKILAIPRRLVSAPGSLAKAWRLMGPLTLLRRHSQAEQRLARSQRLHTWACGDFTLAARESWFRLRGYPEWPMYSWHIDSAFMFAANAHEIREIVLRPPYRIYHIDHSVGSGWSPSGEEQLFNRLRSRGIPFITDDKLRDWQIRAAENPADVVVNGADWGLARLDLPEQFVSRHERKIVITPTLVATAATEA